MLWPSMFFLFLGDHREEHLLVDVYLDFESVLCVSLAIRLLLLALESKEKMATYITSN
jgi:hypothetical protein